jgi:hypothetical protein
MPMQKNPDSRFPLKAHADGGISETTLPEYIEQMQTLSKLRFLNPFRLKRLRPCRSLTRQSIDW